MDSLERSLLTGRMFDQASAQYDAVFTIVTAIFEAASMMAGGGGSATKTQEALKRYRNLLLPSLVEDVKDTAAKAKEMLAREHEQGPFQVQALDYKRPKKRRS